jgi:MoxR-like ATPase
MEEEGKMLMRLQRGHPIDDLKPVVSADDVIACQEAIREIHLDDKVRQYILEVVHASREHEDVLLGGSPRASIALFRTSQALAAINGRDFVLPDDIKKMAQPVLAHRLILKPESRLRKRTPSLVVKDLVEDAKVPITDKQRSVNEDYFDR